MHRSLLVADGAVYCFTTAESFIAVNSALYTRATWVSSKVPVH